MFSKSKYKSFKKFANRQDVIYPTPARASMLKQYSKLGSPEQRLYAACTSFVPSLQDLIREELSSKSEDVRLNIIQDVRNELERKGLHGCETVLSLIENQKI